MAGVVQRGGGRRRRANSEINMVPFIDVMLVLLIIFMVSAPLITTGVVDLPSVGEAKRQPDHVVAVEILKDSKVVKLRVDGGTATEVPMAQLVAQVQRAQAGDAKTPVVIAADQEVAYRRVVEVMDKLQRAGIQRVGLSVKPGSGG